MSIAVESTQTQTNHKQWRPRDSDDENATGILKKARYSSLHITLESESPLPTSEDESVHAEQNYETELAHDTSDTSSHTTWISSSETDNVSVHIEYEIDSHSDADQQSAWASSSSNPEDKVGIQIIPLSDFDRAQLADASGDDAVDSDDDVKQTKYSECVKCKSKNKNQSFPYCEQCFQVRKSQYCRAKRKKKQSQSSQELVSLDSGLASSQESTAQSSIPNMESLSQMSIFSLENGKSPKTNLNLQTSSDNLCALCETNPKNGIFVHGKIAHICCCYECAKKAWVAGKRCIICKRQATQVLKAYYV